MRDNQKISTAKDIDFVSYLSKRGYNPIRSSGKHSFYYSPFGREKDPSFVVNKQKNRFYDYHVGQGGDLITFVMLLDNISFPEAMDSLSNDSFSEIKSYTPPKPKPGITIHSEGDITSKRLLDYFTNERCIDETIVKIYCREVEFSFPFGKNPDKRHRAVGFKTAMNSWELRSSWAKVASPPKSFTFIKGSIYNSVAIFEGFTDFLSMLTYYKIDKLKTDVYILNGVHQFPLVKPLVKDKKIFFYGDNDNASDKILEDMEGMNVVDMRYVYAYYNDFNQMLVDITHS